MRFLIKNKVYEIKTSALILIFGSKHKRNES